MYFTGTKLFSSAIFRFNQNNFNLTTTSLYSGLWLIKSCLCETDENLTPDCLRGGSFIFGNPPYK